MRARTEGWARKRRTEGPTEGWEQKRAEEGRRGAHRDVEERERSPGRAMGSQTQWWEEKEKDGEADRRRERKSGMGSSRDG